MRINKLKNKRGMTLAQTLLYAIISLMVFSFFFTIMANSKSQILTMLNKNDVMYQVYNLEKLMKEIRYATKIINEGEFTLCYKGQANCESSNIKLIDSNGDTIKEYSLEGQTIVLNDNIDGSYGNKRQYYNIEKASFSIVTNTTYNIKALEMHFFLTKGNATYNYTSKVFPLSWMDEEVQPDGRMNLND